MNERVKSNLFLMRRCALFVLVKWFHIHRQVPSVEEVSWNLMWCMQSWDLDHATMQLLTPQKCHHIFLMFQFSKTKSMPMLTRSAWPHVHTYIHVLSLCYLYPLPVTWRVTNVNFQKRLFLCTLLTTLHLRELNFKIPLFNITTVFHRALAFCCSRNIE
jgi:hypothetical protein